MKRVLPLLYLALATWLVPMSARAYEDQATVGLGMGYANAVFQTLPARGAAGNLSGSLGLDDIWSVRAQLSYGFHPDPAPLSVLVAGADLIYAIDIMEWVPYFGGGPDAIGLIRGGSLHPDAGAHLAFGLDWLCTRKLGFELEARSLFLLTALDRNPVYFTLMLSGLLFVDL